MPDHHYRLPTTCLSPRESQITRLVAKGLTNREIAESLLIAPKTVKNILTMIFIKTHSRNRTALAIWCLEHRDAT